MVQHLVVFKFAPSTTTEQKDTAKEKIQSLKEVIDGVEDIKVGHNFSQKNKGFDLGLTVTLKDKEALETYDPHPKHQEVVTYLKEIGLVDLVVVDFET